MNRIGIRAYARHRGVSPTAVSKAIKEGRLKRSVDHDHPRGWPQIDIAMADQEWDANSDPRAQRDNEAIGASVKRAKSATKKRSTKKKSTRKKKATKRKAAKKKSTRKKASAKKPKSESQKDREAGLAGELTLNDARVAKELYAAKKARVDYEKSIGLLVEKSKVRSGYMKIARMIRNNLLNIPARVSGELAAVTDAHEIDVRLTKEITEALQALADAPD